MIRLVVIALLLSLTSLSVPRKVVSSSDEVFFGCHCCFNGHCG